jgi:23S rRNA (uracil1939-C5)-methyltransferase
MKIAKVESLDREGRGVVHVEGKAVFIDGALAGETVGYAPYRSKPSYELAQLLQVIKPSPARIEPPCPHYGNCGGCSMQHLEDRSQVAAKQRVLEDALWHIGRVRAESMLPPIYGMPWHYRHRARLSVRFVPKKGGVLVGFRERRSSYVADMSSCEVLPAAVSAAIPALRELIRTLSVRDRLPQIEVAVGEAASTLILRILQPLTQADETALRALSEAVGMQIWLQLGNPESAEPFWPATAAPLYYTLPEFGVRITFLPTDFTQVNPAVNRILVRRALALLDPRPGERIGDFFCGLGNFTLPIARSGARVIGYEGSERLVARGRQNAAENGIDATCRFEVADLFDAKACRKLGSFDKVLLDPPREGAVELVKSFADGPPRRVVYVSCDPATLARDAGMLVETQGYALRAAGVANMFPHTSHVESVALFEHD